MSAFQEQTNQYVQQIKAGNNSILVAIRVRPLSQKQKKNSTFQTIKVLEGKLLSLVEPQSWNQVDVLRKNRSKQIQYAFDFVFDQQVATKTIYDETVSILLDGLLEGYNASVLAYGATSCGKTYTMIGQNQNTPGIMAMTVLQLLNRANQARKYQDIKLKASYIQIYNQNIKDLLISEDRNLQIREDPKQGITIAGITQVLIDNINQLKTVMKVGNRNRTMESTGSNEVSSRSHGIFQIHIQIRNKAQGTTDETIISKLFLIDLAGSQRASNTTNKGMRMVEGAKINQSLLVLGNCIQALSQASQKGLKNAFVPYRGSKLTRLLKDSLGGNCRTVMIAHLAPAANLFEQTYNTLVYAHRAKNIKNNPIRNTLVAETHLTNYVNIINNLKRQNEQLKSQMRQKQISSLQKSSPYKNNSSLPVLQNPAYNQQISKWESAISKHFLEEDSIAEKINELQISIQQIAFIIYEKQIAKDEKVIKQKSDKASELSKQKLKLQKRLEEKIDLRNKILKEFQKNDILGSNGQSHLKNFYKEKKVQSALKLLKFKEQVLKYQKKKMENLIKKMKNSLKNREDIIQKQKLLIKKNNIISRITYSQLDFRQNDQTLSVKSQQRIERVKSNVNSKSFKKIYIPKTKRTEKEDSIKNQNSFSVSIDKKQSGEPFKEKTSYNQKYWQSPGKRDFNTIPKNLLVNQFVKQKQTKGQLSPNGNGRQKSINKKLQVGQSKSKKKLMKSNSNKVSHNFDFIYLDH